MEKVSTEAVITVLDSKSGRFVTVKGAGALKGMLSISSKVDLTKPIAGQSPKGKWAPKNAGLASASPSKRSSPGRSALKR